MSAAIPGNDIGAVARAERAHRRDPAKAAARDSDWGSPVLESGHHTDPGRKALLSRPTALALAQEAIVGEVAELVWAAEPAERGRLFDQPRVLSPGRLARLRAFVKDGPLSRLQAALPVAGAVDLACYDLRPEVGGMADRSAHRPAADHQC